ncbi:3-hydroxyacyl-CoA dehydrogenase NAD-binding domain-containing protein [Variovorax sp. J22R133]|uniref:3-hydroxyacyl-CoA dehydrogenase NAD-binding domain-containing protein n=1 Tax=Variovorax brevis TaxID=3053503 RepID=UPI0025781C87|nr:3-hydroxyacyl-CoA dehydrogenase NAD-binding domain-containing protein [Variovorax sp. J22R133]MDM0117854.1 3-hydroxyacyl-CoA dehydrogenase NAD-binding domain-containing protein [Variovorax sp. J22R133]
MSVTIDHAAVLGRYRNTCVIGAGVIGASWAALFLAHGLNVVINDPQPGIEAAVRETLVKIGPTLRALGLPHEGLEKNLRFEPDLERAVAGADLVQENGPEQTEWKQQLWARIEKAVPGHALLLSSSSARTATLQAQHMKDPSRLLVGHPFNPPHLIPLVEIVPGERTDPKAVEEAVAFYTALGKVARVLRKEIAGFVANRLQRALFRESCYLVKEGVVTIDELDDIVTSSIGLRWAVNGPFSSFYMGGGSTGFHGFFKQFGPGMKTSWANHSPIEYTDEVAQLIIDQGEAAYAGTPMELMERRRDDMQVTLLRATASMSPSDENTMETQR